MSAIVAEQVVKQFPNEPKPAVAGVSFTVEEGEFIILLGPSGCGKTTLMKMINRLYEPSSGRILVQGKDIAQMPATALRRQIGYVIQQTGLFPHMRIEENIAVVPQLLGWDRARIDPRIDELLTLIGLPVSYRKRYPRQLSGGEQQRVGLARALAADPALMLMDEPFGAIDAITRTRLQDELLRIQQQVRKTIMFVTHDVEEALRLADRIMVLRAGQVVQFDTPLNIITRPANSFVQELVGTEDMLRRLSLLTVRSVLEAPDGAAQAVRGPALSSALATIGLDDDLRSALSILLRSGTDTLQVQDASGAPVGQLRLSDMSAAVAPARQATYE